MITTFPLEQMVKATKTMEENPIVPLYKVTISFSNTYQGEFEGQLNQTTVYDVVDVCFNESILSISKTYETLYFKIKHITSWHVERQ